MKGYAEGRIKILSSGKQYLRQNSSIKLGYSEKGLKINEIQNDSTDGSTEFKIR
jgi:hypothetical protein